MFLDFDIIVQVSLRKKIFKLTKNDTLEMSYREQNGIYTSSRTYGIQSS